MESQGDMLLQMRIICNKALSIMMNVLSFTILINAAPFSQQGAHSAYQFAKAVLSKGHKIVRIFFYGDGIYNGNDFSRLPQDETNLIFQWQKLAEEHGLELVICVSAALRRGVLDNIEAERQDKISNLAAGFTISGLGQLIDAIAQSDRFIVFN